MSTLAPVKPAVSASSYSESRRHEIRKSLLGYTICLYAPE